jgi:hypothetical protein
LKKSRGARDVYIQNTVTLKDQKPTKKLRKVDRVLKESNKGSEHGQFRKLRDLHGKMHYSF